MGLMTPLKSQVITRSRANPKRARLQIGEGGAHAIAAARVEHVAVGNDDAIEIPAQDFFDRLAAPPCDPKWHA